MRPFTITYTKVRYETMMAVAPGLTAFDNFEWVTNLGKEGWLVVWIDDSGSTYTVIFQRLVSSIGINEPE